MPVRRTKHQSLPIFLVVVYRYAPKADTIQETCVRVVTPATGARRCLRNEMAPMSRWITARNSSKVAPRAVAMTAQATYPRTTMRPRAWYHPSITCGSASDSTLPAREAGVTWVASVMPRQRATMAATVSVNSGVWKYLLVDQLSNLLAG